MAHAAVYRFEHPGMPALGELASGHDGAWWTHQEVDESVAYIRRSLKLPRHYCRSCDVPVGHDSVLLEHPKSARQMAEDRATAANHAPGVQPAARADDEPSQCEFAKARKPYTPQHARKATEKRWVITANQFRKAVGGILGKKDRVCTDRARQIVELPTDASMSSRSLETQCVDGGVGILGNKDHICTDRSRQIAEPPTDASMAGSLETQCVNGGVDGSSAEALPARIPAAHKGRQLHLA